MQEKSEDIINSRKKIKESHESSSKINQGTNLPGLSTSPYSFKDTFTYAAGMLFGDSVSHNECGIATPGRNIDGHVVGVKKGSLQSITSNTRTNVVKQALRIVVAGDVMVSKSGQAIKLSDELKESISHTDVIIINIESPISFASKERARSGLDFIMSKTYLEQFICQLKEKNPTLTIVYDIANNHTLDGGGFRGDAPEKERALEDLDQENFPILRTVAALREIDQNAVIIGAHLAEDKYNSDKINCQTNPLAIVEKNGMCCGFIGFTDVMNHNARSWDKRVVRMDDIIPEELEKIKKEQHLDQLFLIGHGNIEQCIYPRKVWRDKMLQCLKGGADAVFGHGPHVPLTNEVLTIDGKDKYIAHSVGNFYGPTKLNNTGLNCIAKYTVQPDMNIEFEMQPIEAAHDQNDIPVVGIVGGKAKYPQLMQRYNILFPQERMSASFHALDPIKLDELSAEETNFLNELVKLKKAAEDLRKTNNQIDAEQAELLHNCLSTNLGKFKTQASYSFDSFKQDSIRAIKATDQHLSANHRLKNILLNLLIAITAIGAGLMIYNKIATGRYSLFKQHSLTEQITDLDKLTNTSQGPLT